MTSRYPTCVRLHTHVCASAAVSTEEKKPYLPDPERRESQNKAAVVCEANKKGPGGDRGPAHTITMILNFA